jgi:SAM-dependent methyltransferase
MLREHLSQDHDLASRRSEKIDAQIEWLSREILPTHASVLDLGCGPGLYTSRLAALGHTCVGVDFSPASIEYAWSQAVNASLDCTCVLEDLVSANFGTGFDAVLLLYAEFNTFPRREAEQLLLGSREPLKPGGRLVLEVHTAEQVRQLGIGAPSWYVRERGLFADDPHLCLIDCAWDGAVRASAERFTVFCSGSDRPRTFVCTTQAYTASAYEERLESAGFTSIQSRVSPADTESDAGAALMMITAAAPAP